MRHFVLGILSAVAAAVVALVVMVAIGLVDRSFAPFHYFDLFSPAPHVATTTDSVPFHKQVMTTVFWVGEGSTAENGFISNVQSYWDEYWGEHFGGVDDPENRCGYAPCTFTPKENPFYVALPYGEFDQNANEVKSSAAQIPWYGTDDKLLLKNRWVEVVYQGNTCYGQWEDVGPFMEDDFSYVFGEAEPRNTFGVKAGLDVSPALWDCLGMTDNTYTKWRFVAEEDVPPGPWKETVTTSGITWWHE